jgi:hypothetical protein
MITITKRLGPRDLSVQQRPNQRNRGVKCKAGSPGRGVRATNDHDPVSCIDELRWLYTHVRVDLEDLSKGPSDFRTATGPWLNCLRELVPFVDRRQELPPDPEVALRPAFMDEAHDLHVLFRHRLLRQPGGVEGLGSLLEHAKACDSPRLHREQERAPRDHLNPLAAA